MSQIHFYLKFFTYCVKKYFIVYVFHYAGHLLITKISLKISQNKNHIEGSEGSISDIYKMASFL